MTAPIQVQTINVTTISQDGRPATTQITGYLGNALAYVDERRGKARGNDHIIAAYIYETADKRLTYWPFEWVTELDRAEKV